MNPYFRQLEEEGLIRCSEISRVSGLLFKSIEIEADIRWREKSERGRNFSCAL